MARLGSIKEKKKKYIGRNFIWNHAVFNIYFIIIVNIFHQLLEKIVIVLIDWIKCFFRRRHHVYEEKTTTAHRMSNWCYISIGRSIRINLKIRKFENVF